MRLSYELRAVCGVVYTQGNLVFDSVTVKKARKPQGKEQLPDSAQLQTLNEKEEAEEEEAVIREGVLYAAIGHRVNAYDLIAGEQRTLPIHGRHAITSLSVSPDRRFMVLIEAEQGYAQLIALQKSVVLKHFRVHPQIAIAKFTSDSRYLILAGDRFIEVWAVPGIPTKPKINPSLTPSSNDNNASLPASTRHPSTYENTFLDFQPLRKVAEFKGHEDVITSIDFESNAEGGWTILSASLDMTLKIFRIHENETKVFDRSQKDTDSIMDLEKTSDLTLDGSLAENVQVKQSSEVYTKEGVPVLRAHKDGVLGAFFIDSTHLVSVSREGAIFFWQKGTRTIKKNKRDTNTGSNRSQTHSLNTSNRHRQPIGNGGWQLIGRQYLNLTDALGKVSAVAWHRGGSLLAIGLTSGTFQVARISFDSLTSHNDGGTNASLDSLEVEASLPQLLILQTLHVFGDGAPLSAVAFDSSGTWLALGSSKARRVAVYSWRTETFLLKQKGAAFYGSLTCAAVSRDTPGARLAASGLAGIVATGDSLGNIVLHDARTHLAFLSFSAEQGIQLDNSKSSKSSNHPKNVQNTTHDAIDGSDPPTDGRLLSGHMGSITSLCFVKGAQVLLSASVDGTVRAHDLLRYRPSFRILTAPGDAEIGTVALMHVAADALGDFVFATGSNAGASPLIYVWHLPTGKLVDVLAGHAAPLTSLVVDPLGRYLLTGGLDKRVRLWTLFGSGQEGRDTSLGRHDAQELVQGADVTALTFSPDGKNFLVATLDGLVQQYNTETLSVLRTYTPFRDLPRPRSAIADQGVLAARKPAALSSMAFAPHGGFWIGAGSSPALLLYDSRTGHLLKQLPLTTSLLLENVLSKLSSNRQMNTVAHTRLPGTALDRRTFRPDMRVSSVAFLPDARTFVALSTEGLALYSLDQQNTKIPLQYLNDGYLSNSESFTMEGDMQAPTPASIMARYAVDPPGAFLLALNLADKAPKLVRHLLLNVQASEEIMVDDSLDANSSENAESMKDGQKAKGPNNILQSAIAPRKSISKENGTSDALCTRILAIVHAIPDSAFYLAAMLKLLADALNMHDGDRGFPLDILLTWMTLFFKVHASAMHTHICATASYASTNVSLLNSININTDVDAVIAPTPSNQSTALTILPHLIAIQTSLRRLYHPLAAVTLTNLRTIDVLLDMSASASKIEQLE